MMMLRTIVNNFFKGCIFAVLAAPVSGAEVSGEAIGFACSGCHGPGGRLVESGMPSLNGQSAEALRQKLLDFKYDRKSSSIMTRIAKGYTDSELKTVALYFSGLN